MFGHLRRPHTPYPGIPKAHGFTSVFLCNVRPKSVLTRLLLSDQSPRSWKADPCILNLFEVSLRLEARKTHRAMGMYPQVPSLWSAWPWALPKGQGQKCCGLVCCLIPQIRSSPPKNLDSARTWERKESRNREKPWCQGQGSSVFKDRKEAQGLCPREFLSAPPVPRRRWRCLSQTGALKRKALGKW